MFNECAQLDARATFGDVILSGEPVWQQLGFPDKAAWKQAGRPTGGAAVTTTSGSAVPGAGAGAGAGAGTATSGGLLSGIPTTYLFIGGAILLLMMMKK